MKHLIAIFVIPFCHLLPAAAQAKPTNALSSGFVWDYLPGTEWEKLNLDNTLSSTCQASKAAIQPELLVVLGLIGFGVGTGTGIGVGYAIDHDYGDSWSPTQCMWIGGLAGGAVRTPAAIHIGNGRRGSLLLAGIASSAVTVAALPLARTNLAYLLVIPAARISVSIAIERLTD